MKRKDSGFTLIELMVVIAILSILASVVIGGFSSGSTDGKVNALDNRQAYIDESGINMREIKRKSCTVDSDYDGWASCTIMMNDGEKIELQCSTDPVPDEGIAKGCKEQKVQIVKEMER